MAVSFGEGPSTIFICRGTGVKLFLFSLHRFCHKKPGAKFFWRCQQKGLGERGGIGERGLQLQKSL